MHHVAWVTAPLALAIVLGFSAATKVGKGESLRSIIENLELPAWVLPRWLARAVPAIEVALAAGLLTPWRPVFAVAAGATLLLMAVYWALIARGLTITPRPSCGCFGQVGDQSISARTLVRNTALVAAAVAGTALAVSGRTLWSLLADATRGDWLWLALTALACTVTGLVLAGAAAGSADGGARGEHGADASLPAHSPAVGSAAAGDEGDDDYVRTRTPELVLHDPVAGGPVTLHELSAKRAQLLVFVNCYCMSTKEVMADIEVWHERMDLVDVRMVFSVPIAEQFVGPPPPRTLLDHRGLAWQALGLLRSPSAVLLGVDGFLAGGPVGGPLEVKEFVDVVAETLEDSAAVAAQGSPGEQGSPPLGHPGDGVEPAPGGRQLTGDR